MSTVSGIQGQLLEVTVVGCSRLKDTEWFSRQDPYVCLEYATTKFRTRTCTDGGKNPVFQERTVVTLIEGLREIGVTVWNSNTLTFDDFIGSGRIQLHKVLSQGYDDSSWPLQTKSGKYAGDVKLIMHYANAQVSAQKQKQAAPSYPQTSYAPPPPATAPYAPPATTSYPPIGSYPSPYPAAYSAPTPAPYPTYPPHMQSAYPPGYPPQQPHPQPQGQTYYPPGPYPGTYPPPY